MPADEVQGLWSRFSRGGSATRTAPGQRTAENRTEIVEYQRHTLNCRICGAKNRAEWPAEMPKGSFSARLQGMIGYLSGRFGISHRDMVELMETVFEVEISLGSIPAQQQRVSLALKEPVETAQKHVQKQTAVNMDETGWYEMAKDFWLWVCTTPEVSVFRIFDSRSGSGAKTLLGETIRGQLARIVSAAMPGSILPIANCVGRISSAISRHWSSVGMNPK